jgi:hypothetical protein
MTFWLKRLTAFGLTFAFGAISFMIFFAVFEQINAIRLRMERKAEINRTVKERINECR